MAKWLDLPHSEYLYACFKYKFFLKQMQYNKLPYIYPYNIGNKWLWETVTVQQQAFFFMALSIEQKVLFDLQKAMNRFIY